MIDENKFIISYEMFKIFVQNDKIVMKGRNVFMKITATQFKNGLGKYLLLAETQDIYITRNDKVIAKLSNPNQDRVDIAKSLFGILSSDVTLEQAKKERLNKK